MTLPSSNQPGTAVVTGASTGIGAVYADRLARRGHDLVLVARNEERLEALAARLRAETGRAVEILVADLAASADVAKVEQRIAGDEAVTMLVNNAGMSLRGGTLDNGPAEIEQIIALNVAAVARLAIAAGRAFVARGRGQIVNMSSVLGLDVEMFEGAYAGSKAFILAISQNLAAKTRDKGVHVQVVLPGATRTEIWERAGHSVDAFPPDWVMGVDDLVDAALVGLDRGEEVTIPPLHDEALWAAHDASRRAMAGKLSNREPAARYRAREVV